jgi:hypothetical protein
MSDVYELENARVVRRQWRSEDYAGFAAMKQTPT